MASSVRFERLSVITLGGNSMRFIGLDEENNAALFPHVVTDCPGRLLFVGSDVLSGTSVMKKNYIRNHVRYAKMGFATKLTLTGFKIEGIHYGGMVWFYSIQGLFHVAFEMGNLTLQKDCLTNLQDVWLKRYHDPTLPREGVLRYNKHPDEQMQTEDKLYKQCQSKVHKKHGFSSTNNSHLIYQEPDYRQNDSQASHQSGALCTEQVTDYVNMEMVAEHKEDKEVCSNSDQPVNLSKNVIEEMEVVLVQDYNKDEVADDIAKLKDKFDLYPRHEVREFRETILEYFQNHYTSETSIKFTSYVLLTLEYLAHFANSDANSLDFTGMVIFTWMEEFLLLVNADSRTLEHSISYDIKEEKYILLGLVSEWLGNEYHNLECQIGQKVKKFKEQNILSIYSLPSSENIVNTLFPAFMKTFIMNWLGFSEKGIKADSCIDHCYTFSTVNPSLNQKTNFPLVQLMLEFGTNCLISGITHVVLCRLKAQSESENQVSAGSLD